MQRVLLVGAGKIGGTIASFLTRGGDYDVLVADADAASLRRVAEAANVRTVQLSADDPAALRKAASGRGVVVSATSFALNPAIAAVALEAGASYFDLTEDRQTTAAVRHIARRAKPGQVFMPQCGLAPGFVSIAANYLTRDFDRLDEVRMRVGALPQFPTNEMKYNLTWSTDGLINEYGNPCEAVHEGRQIETLPLEGLEHFSLDGIDYEAFNTSGGVGTLCETLSGKVRTLNYKTIRYRGHRDLMAFLLNELRLNDRRTVLKDILENAVPITVQDVVLIFCTVSGWKDGPPHPGDRRAEDLPRRVLRRAVQRHPDHHRRKPLRRARPAHARQADRHGLPAAGAGAAGRVPRQPFRQVLRLRRARRSGEERGEERL